MVTPSSLSRPQRYVFAGMTICVAMMAALLWMPALFGVLSQRFALSSLQLSHLAFTELFGFLAGTVLAIIQTYSESMR
jgi:hypothetical protein